MKHTITGSNGAEFFTELCSVYNGHPYQRYVGQPIMNPKILEHFKQFSTFTNPGLYAGKLRDECSTPIIISKRCKVFTTQTENSVF